MEEVVMEEDSDVQFWDKEVREPTYTFGEQLDEVKRKQLLTLLGKHKVFSKKPGRTNMREHHIETGDARPVRLPAYRLPHAYREDVAKELKEKECLAIKLAISAFRVYLLGRKFMIQTDHRSLEWLDRLKESNPRLCRWSLSLQPYQYEVVHRSGKMNMNADTLSRAATT